MLVGTTGSAIPTETATDPLKPGASINQTIFEEDITGIITLTLIPSFLIHPQRGNQAAPAFSSLQRISCSPPSLPLETGQCVMRVPPLAIFPTKSLPIKTPGSNSNACALRSLAESVCTQQGIVALGGDGCGNIELGQMQGLRLLRGN